MISSILASVVGAVVAAGTATNTWPYVIVSWLVVFGSLAVYAVVTVVRGRRLSRRVPPEDRRWS